MTLTSISISSLDPTLVIFFSWSALKSFGCRLSGNSPISSRKMEPPFAVSNNPIRLEVAPVNAPFSCPKSSLSKRFSGMVAQFSSTNGRSFRSLRRWMSLAMSSLPVPVSPWINTVHGVTLTLCTRDNTCFMGRLSAMILIGSGLSSSSFIRFSTSSRS